MAVLAAPYVVLRVGEHEQRSSSKKGAGVQAVWAGAEGEEATKRERFVFNMDHGISVVRQTARTARPLPSRLCSTF